MDVEDMKGRASFRLKFHVKTTATLASWHGNVVIARAADGLAGEEGISVGATPVTPVFAQLAGESKTVGKIPRLVMIGRLPVMTDDLLQSNDIGIDLPQNAENAVGSHTSVQPTAFVDVVRYHTEPA